MATPGHAQQTCLTLTPSKTKIISTSTCSTIMHNKRILGNVTNNTCTSTTSLAVHGSPKQTYENWAASKPSKPVSELAKSKQETTNDNRNDNHNHQVSSSSSVKENTCTTTCTPCTSNTTATATVDGDSDSSNKIFRYVQWRNLEGSLKLTEKAILFRPHCCTIPPSTKTKRLAWDQVESHEVKTIQTTTDNKKKYLLKIKVKKFGSLPIILRFANAQDLQDIDREIKTHQSNVLINNNTNNNKQSADAIVDDDIPATTTSDGTNTTYYPIVRLGGSIPGSLTLQPDQFVFQPTSHHHHWSLPTMTIRWHRVQQHQLQKRHNNQTSSLKVICTNSKLPILFQLSSSRELKRLNQDMSQRILLLQQGQPNSNSNSTSTSNSARHHQQLRETFSSFLTPSLLNSNIKGDDNGNNKKVTFQSPVAETIDNTHVVFRVPGRPSKSALKTTTTTTTTTKPQMSVICSRMMLLLALVGAVIVVAFHLHVLMVPIINVLIPTTTTTTSGCIGAMDHHLLLHHAIESNNNNKEWTESVSMLSTQDNWLMHVAPSSKETRQDDAYFLESSSSAMAVTITTPLPTIMPMQTMHASRHVPVMDMLNDFAFGNTVTDGTVMASVEMYQKKSGQSSRQMMMMRYWTNKVFDTLRQGMETMAEISMECSPPPIMDWNKTPMKMVLLVVGTRDHFFAAIRNGMETWTDVVASHYVPGATVDT